VQRIQSPDEGRTVENTGCDGSRSNRERLTSPSSVETTLFFRHADSCADDEAQHADPNWVWGQIVECLTAYAERVSPSFLCPLFPPGTTPGETAPGSQRTPG